MKKYNWIDKISEEELNDVCKTLKEGGVVIFPTETVYGIAACALNKNGVDKLYKAKRRPREKAINIMVSKKQEIERYAYIKNEVERQIIDKFMPGELTIILDKKDDFGNYFTLSDGTIGVRIPDSDIALTILSEVSMPLIVSSANISGMASGVDPDEIEKYFNESVDILIDGGIINKGIPSTIVRVQNEKIKIIREGKITKEKLESQIETGY